MADSTAVQITVPSDFRTDFLAQDGFKDLVFTAADGHEVKTNSVILAFNSPVVARLVGETWLKNIDVSEFSANSVVSFVECCFSGSADNLSEDNFREMNKLSIALGVEWMRKACLQLFCDWCSSLQEDSFDSVWRLFQEAGFLLQETRNRKFLKALNNRLKELPDLRRAVVLHYIQQDPNSYHWAYTDMAVALAGPDIPAVFEGLSSLLEGRYREEGSLELTDCERRLLNPAIMGRCYESNPTVYDRVIGAVENSQSADDLRFVVKLMRAKGLVQSQEGVVLSEDKEITALQLVGTEEEQGAATSETQLVYPLEFPAFLTCKSLEELMAALDRDERVTTGVLFLNAIVDWVVFYKGTVPTTLSGSLEQELRRCIMGRPFPPNQDYLGYTGLHHTCRALYNVLERVVADSPAKWCGSGNVPIESYPFERPLYFTVRLSRNCDQAGPGRYCAVAVQLTPQTPRGTLTVELQESTPGLVLKYHLHQDPAILQHVRPFIYRNTQITSTPTRILLSWCATTSESIARVNEWMNKMRGAKYFLCVMLPNIIK